ncbi:hypothetical protein FRC0114_02031 [Corynebacterium diphtheriae]|nr:hypothetical protein FRC0114_02031 [Corynebacterium diphtheriae]
MLRGVKACVVFSLVVGVVLDWRDMPKPRMQPLLIIPMAPPGYGAFRLTPDVYSPIVDSITALS